MKLAKSLLLIQLQLIVITPTEISNPCGLEPHHHCNCYYVKEYDESLDITCFNASITNCSWSRIINNMSVPIGDSIRVNANTITLPGDFDLWGYGTFMAKFSNEDSCLYSVIPSISAETCNDCIGIKINGSRQSSNENFCAPIGSNVIIQADVPLISSQHSVYLRFNGNEMNCLSNCEKSSNLTYHCNNLTAINYGNYCIHVRFTYDPEERIPEWQSDNITIVVQSFISFNQSMYNVSESTGRIRPVINISNPLLIDITLEVLTTNGTASGNNIDYGPGPYIVMIPAGTTMTNESFEIKINNDDIIEGNETFSLAINVSSLPDCISLADPNKTEVIIMDDDVTTVSFEQAIYEVSENSTAQVALNLSKSASVNISVQVLDTSITATGGMDYTSGPYNVVFPAGQTNALLSVTIHDDSTLESNENFTLIIDPSLLPSIVNLGDPNHTTITIVDNNNAVVKFEKKIYCYNDDQMLPKLTLSTKSSTNVTIQVYSKAFGQSMDTEPFNVITITFPAGKICANVPLTNSMIEGNHEAVNFTLNINNSSLLHSNVNVTVGDPAQATITTLDKYCSGANDDDDSNAAAIVGGIVSAVVGIVLITS